MTDIDLKPLYDVISGRNLMERWGDGLFVETDEDRKQLADKKLKEAEANYIRMMSSPKNDNSDQYQHWAIGTALGVKPTKAR